MGLGGGRKRVKISSDPNNTTWSRSTTNFGHRQLVSQGWTPGSTLGAHGPSYAKHLTQASQSHIRVVLRDDNLGLGAKRGSGQEAGECVGLDAFQAMLGRLNGKSEGELKKEADSREDLKRQKWVEGKGMINFVYGGRLVGDDYDEMEEEEKGAQTIDTAAQDQDAGDKDQTEMEEAAKKTKTEIKDKKSRKEKRSTESSLEETATEETDTRASRKGKKRKHRLEEEEASMTGATAIELESPNAEDEAIRNARRKTEKAERKERKRLKREAKAAKAAGSNSGTGEATVHTVLANPIEAVKEILVVEPATKAAPSFNQASGRHMSVRSRYIAAKRRAVMDPQALKEILMVKA